jgi:hypothetical protein
MFIEVNGVNEPDYATLAIAFFASIDSYKRAAAVWNGGVDQAC